MLRRYNKLLLMWNNIFNRRNKPHEKNKFRTHNKSLLINVFMNDDYKWIFDDKRMMIPEPNNITKKQGFGFTAITAACYLNKLHIARLSLIYKNSRSVLNHKTLFQFTALDCAKKHNNKKLINLLKSYGATQ